MVNQGNRRGRPLIVTTRVVRIEDTLIEMMETISRLAVAPQQPIQTVVDNKDDSELRQNRIHAWLHERDGELEENFDSQGVRNQQVRADLRRPTQVANSGHLSLLRGQRIDRGRVFQPMVGRQQQQPQDRVLRGPRQDIPRRN
ncbi:hypothetical protein FRX31_034823 [Thalictrum thalictroides]|uniref:Uncharacterized protein n=1 Tax=Thalictrum thalictroides TaxID=46969 RepID=A0A7J6USS8_THATH|nr:hypothetical protein FRX31_034823 [Thalictrum thalictroides]